MLAPGKTWRQDDPAETGAIEKLQFSPDGRRLLVSFDHGRGDVWNVETHRRMYSIETGYDLIARWSPDASRLAACLGGVVHIRNAETGEERPAFAEPESAAREICFVQGGNRSLVTNCKFGPPWIFDPRSGRAGRWFSQGSPYYDRPPGWQFLRGGRKKPHVRFPRKLFSPARLHHAHDKETGVVGRKKCASSLEARGFSRREQDACRRFHAAKLHDQGPLGHARRRRGPLGIVE